MGTDVMGDILPHLTITARNGAQQFSVFIAQAHGQAIKLGLGHILHLRRLCIQRQFTAYARIKGLRTRGFIVGFGADGQHGHGMAHWRQPVQHCTDHPLRR